jgi:hypothetical protein
MNDEIEAAGQRVFEMFGACAAAPDDVALGQEADRALAALDELLR